MVEAALLDAAYEREAKQQATIDALVAALEAMRDTYAIDGRGYPRTGPVVDQCRDALALARGGK